MSVENCAYCGKEFLMYGPTWGYAYGGRLVCSYKCMRAMRREAQEAKARRKGMGEKYRMLTDEEKARICELRGQGMTFRQIAGELGVSEKTVGEYYRRTMRRAAAAEQAAAVDEQATSIDGQAAAVDEQATAVPRTDDERAPGWKVEAVRLAEEAVAEAKSAYTIDRARVISVLCDAIELLCRVYMEAES